MKDTPADKKPKEKIIECGIIMPISPQDGCSADHWVDVKEIIQESISTIDGLVFQTKLVSDSDEIGVIQKRIVQNIYSSDIVICDVSTKNPNVMFELGMRLAFDKPTVIIKDDKTEYSFDTGIIEHLTYPRDLRYSTIQTFKKTLAEKVVGTHRAAIASPDHSPFLKNFGKFQVANISEDVIPADKMIFEMLQDMQMEITRLRRSAIGVSGRTKFTNIGAMRSGLKKYMEIHGAARVEEIDMDSRFFDEMEKLCDAPKHFDSFRDFKDSLEIFIQSERG